MSEFVTESDFEDFSDSDSAFDPTDDAPINQLPIELLDASDDGIISNGGIISLLQFFCIFPSSLLIYSITDTLIVSGFAPAFVNRVGAILKNYFRIREWMINSTKYSFSNYKQLDDPLNNFTPVNNGYKTFGLSRGIWRWLTFTPENKLELILAVPPRHWAFGKSATELPIPDCIETLTYDEFHKKYNEYSMLHTPISFHWWFIVIQPFATVDGTYYNTLEDILNAVLSTNTDIQPIKAKDVITISRLKDMITTYCDLLNEYHQSAIGHEYKDRLPRRANKRTRERRKRKLLRHGYTVPTHLD